MYVHRSKEVLVVQGTAIEDKTLKGTEKTFSG